MSYGIKLNIEGEKQRDVLDFSINYFQPDKLDPACICSMLLAFYKDLGFIPRDYVQPRAPNLKDYNRFKCHSSMLPYRDNPLGGLLHLTLESTDDDELFYYSLKELKTLHGKLEFYNYRDDDMPFRRLEFW
ncbi:MAG: hypothetical protein LBT04_02170, partial [Prevotellaceae bacterium]|nr:hypothetical protein [Prevotellaceae bacterium]